MRMTLVLLMGAHLFAQSSTITGTVTDDLGEALASAAIQATDAESKEVLNARSSTDGAFRLQLKPGTYTLSAYVPAMQFYQQKGVVLHAGETLNLKIKIHDGFNLNTVGDGREQIIFRATPHPAPDGPAPQINGKPDLSGMWYAPRTVAFGPPEPLPWVEALIRERIENELKDWPLTQCLPLGATLFASRDFYRLIQTPNYLLILSENDVPNYRQVFMDGRTHPEDLEPTWMGHSIGKWDGDTLVVDTVGFNDKTWNPDYSSPTPKMRLIERFRRPDLGHLEIELTIDDPGAYKKPWTIKRVSDLAPKEDVREFICGENNRDLVHMVGK